MPQKNDGPELAAMERHALGIGQTIGGVLEEQFGEHQIGFCLMLFSANKEPGEGWSTFISNVQPEGLIAALRELADKRETQLKETGK